VPEADISRLVGHGVVAGRGELMGQQPASADPETLRAVALRPRREGRNRALLIGLLAFAATAFVTALSVGVLVDLKENGHTRLEALIGVGSAASSSQAQNGP
jgi:hypothetical protein